MKSFFSFFIAALLFINIANAQSAAQDNESTSVFHDVTQLANYTGKSQTAVVTDELRGGIFFYTKEKRTADNGVVFDAQGGGSWVRIYDKAVGVDVAWFGAAADGKTDDKGALNNALIYPRVIINGNLAIAGDINIPEGKTIVFTEKGAVTVTGSFTTTIDGAIKADDYQYIFKGTGNVIFGQESAPYISACWFGAVADCKGFARGEGKDNTTAIQNAIAAAEKLSDVYLPPSAADLSYRITSTITISKKQHFFSFRFHGGGTAITASKDDRATTLFADFTTGAAINVQGSRRVYLSDFILHGINKAPNNVWSNWKTYLPAMDSVKHFLSPGISENYVGIATDAEKDNKIWSADVVFERLQIESFYLGIGISQAGNLQGDRMRVENTQINDCAYGVSLGNAQNRSCHFLNLDMNHIWCCFTNNTFGNNTGSEFQVTGGQWCNCYKLFHVQPYNMGQCVVSGLYTEAIGSIGEIGTGSSNNNSFLFTGCELAFQDGGAMGGENIYSKYYTLTAYANVTFLGCNFWTWKPYLAMCAGAVNGHLASCITLSGCSFNRASFLHVWGSSIIENSYLLPESMHFNYNNTIRADIEGAVRFNTSFNSTAIISTGDNEYEGDNKKSYTKQIVRKIQRFYCIQQGKDNISDIRIHGDTIHFRYNDLLQKKLFRYVLAGDVLGTTLKEGQTMWDNPDLQILAIDNNSKTITALMYTDQLTLDNIALYTNSFIIMQPVTGEIKHGSNIVTGITNADKLYEGDFITFKESQNVYRIRKVDKEAHTLELMDNIAENINRTVTLYNQEMLDEAQEAETLDTTSTGAIATKNFVRKAASGNAFNIRTVTAAQATLTADDYTIEANSVSNNINISLPPDAAKGQIFYIKKTVAEHEVTIKPQSGTIDNDKAYILQHQYQAVQLQFDGSNYIILSK